MPFFCLSHDVTQVLSLPGGSLGYSGQLEAEHYHSISSVVSQFLRILALLYYVFYWNTSCKESVQLAAELFSTWSLSYISLW